MCVVSMTGDYWKDVTFPTKWPDVDPLQPIYDQVTREEFNQLKKDFYELRELLKAAKAYDEALGEPDCEMDSKVELIKKLAKELDVDLSEVFG